MDTQEKIEACEKKKHDGNLLFKAEKYRRASDKYEKVKYLSQDLIESSLLEDVLH